jgi:hypothetical protein
MNITNFKLPETKICIVVWYRNGNKNETVIDTPKTNQVLVNTMFEHRVGASEIRAIKGIDFTSLPGLRSNAFGRGIVNPQWC